MRKFNDLQVNYTVEGKELLGIVEQLKAFAGAIRGQDLTVHTDHLNLLYSKLPSQQMTRWRLLLEEYNSIVVHIKDVDNDTADALSRLDLIDKADDASVWGEKSKQLEYVNVHVMNICMFLLESEFKEDCFDDDVMMSMTKTDDPPYVLDLKSMQKAQFSDKDMINMEDSRDNILGKLHLVTNISQMPGEPAQQVVAPTN